MPQEVNRLWKVDPYAMGNTQGAVDIKTPASPVAKPAVASGVTPGTKLKTAHLGQDVGRGQRHNHFPIQTGMFSNILHKRRTHTFSLGSVIGF